MSENNDTSGGTSTRQNDASSVPEQRKGELGELAQTAVIAILLALLIRTFLYEPFNIPSGSMLPTLKIGDYLFASKMSYGYSRYSFPFGIASFDGRIYAGKPERGDIVVFRLPSHPSTNYIKRVVALEGESVQMIGGRLYINGQRVPRVPLGHATLDSAGPLRPVLVYNETLPGGFEHVIYEESDTMPLDDTPRFTVPKGHVFMMGDNRDNSRDSRAFGEVGFIPLDNLVGRAELIFFSTDGSAALYEFWKWPFALRYSRFFTWLPSGSQAPDPA